MLMTPDLLPSERATWDRFDSATPAPESATERVARAISDVDQDGGWDDWSESVHVIYRAYATAAIDALAGPAPVGPPADTWSALADELARTARYWANVRADQSWPPEDRAHALGRESAYTNAVISIRAILDGETR